MNTERINAIHVKTQEVLAKAKLLYGVDLNPIVSFNLRGKTAGMAHCETCKRTFKRIYKLRYNADYIDGKHFEDMRDETVPHEIAHLVCFALPHQGKNHNAGWARVCRALGGNAKTRHNYEVIYAGGGWDYLTNRGHKVTISNVRHAKVQAGKTYTWRHGKGTISRFSRFCRAGGTMPDVAANKLLEGMLMPGDIKPRPNLGSRLLPPVPDTASSQAAADAAHAALLARLAGMPAATPPVHHVQRRMTPVTPVVRPASGGTSWANQVRAVIARAKAERKDQAWVIAHAVNVLGMNPSSARNCVKFNWDRV